MNAKDVQRDHKRLLDNLRMIQKKYNVKDLSKLLGISPNTWTNRMKQPWKAFSYDDFRLLSRYCEIDFITLMEGEIKLR